MPRVSQRLIVSSYYSRPNVVAADNVANEPLSSNAQGDAYGDPQRAAAGGNQPGYGNNIGAAGGPYEDTGRYGQPGQGVGAAAGATGGTAHHDRGYQTEPSGNTAQTHGGGGGSRVTGKVESAMGTMLGSESLKRKGMEKEQFSDTITLS